MEFDIEEALKKHLDELKDMKVDVEIAHDPGIADNASISQVANTECQILACQMQYTGLQIMFRILRAIENNSSVEGYK